MDTRSFRTGKEYNWIIIFSRYEVFTWYVQTVTSLTNFKIWRDGQKRCQPTISNEYINPFGSDLDQLFNLTLGATIDDSNAEILNIRKVGKDNYNELKKNRLSRKLEKFQDPIERNDLPLFSSANKSVQIKQNTRTKAVEIDRNIVGTLLAYCAKNEKVTDFEKALEYPLCSVPLSLANPDGSCRATTKSKLLEVIVKKCDSPLQHPREN